MANKRMFSKQITTSDAFLDMPVSSQLLYFHLNMEADDDGFVANPKRMIRMLSFTADDLKLLIAKRFVLSFKSGLIVIKHWLLHNVIRKDMYKETQYLDEKNMLQIKDNRVYTEIRDGSVTKPLHRIDKIRLDKKNSSKKNSSSFKEKLDDDISIDPTIDPETGDPIKKFGKNIDGKAEPKYINNYNETVKRIVNGFQKMCKKELGTAPISNISWYKQANRAISTGGLTEKDIKKLLSEWFTQRLPEEQMCSLTRALSDVQINKYKMMYSR